MRCHEQERDAFFSGSIAPEKPPGSRGVVLHVGLPYFTVVLFTQGGEAMGVETFVFWVMEELGDSRFDLKFESRQIRIC